MYQFDKPDKLSFHDSVKYPDYNQDNKALSCWYVDDINEEHKFIKLQKKYCLVRLVHAKVTEPSMARYFLAQKDTIFQGYLALDNENNTDLISYGNVYKFDRQLFKDMCKKNPLHTDIFPNIINSIHIGKALSRDFEFEYKLSLDIEDVMAKAKSKFVYDGPNYSNEKPFKLHVLNVGQGDTIILEFPNNRIWMIDAYFTRKMTIQYFKQWLSDNIPGYYFDRLILSHLHYDHIKSAEQIIRDLRPKNVVIADIIAKPSSTALNTLNTASKYSNFVYLSVADVVHFGNTEIVSFPTTLYPMASRRNDPNTHGIIITFNSNRSQLILSGDAHGDQLNSLINNNTHFHVDEKKRRYYKVTHHCSSTGHNRQFLLGYNPDNAATSCGLNNHYFHPSTPPRNIIDSITRRNVGRHKVTAEQKKKEILFFL